MTRRKDTIDYLAIHKAEQEAKKRRFNAFLDQIIAAYSRPTRLTANTSYRCCNGTSVLSSVYFVDTRVSK